jgi:hypothetical protein
MPVLRKNPFSKCIGLIISGLFNIAGNNSNYTALNGRKFNE